MTTGLVMLFSASIAQKSLEKLAKRLFLSEAERPSKPGRATAKIVKWGASLAIVSFHIQGPLARPGISTSVCFPEPYLSRGNIPASNEAVGTGAGRKRAAAHRATPAAPRVKPSRATRRVPTEQGNRGFMR